MIRSELPMTDFNVAFQRIDDNRMNIGCKIVTSIRIDNSEWIVSYKDLEHVWISSINGIISNSSLWMNENQTLKRTLVSFAYFFCSSVK